MPKRTSFLDQNDEFYVDEHGNLVHRNIEQEEITLVLTGELEDFICWLTDEVDRLKSEKAEEPTNG